jgi:hypothetical protein
MAKKSPVTIQKLPGNYPPYEVTCNKEGHDFDFTMAETMAEAREAKANPVNWCNSCNTEYHASRSENMGRQFNGRD